MTDGAAAEQALANAEAGADRLQRTLEQLLLLARVEGSLDFDDGLQCSAAEVARLAIQDASGGDGAPILLQIPTELPDTPLAMPPVLAIAALRNLLENAQRHTAPGTAVTLTLHAEPARVRFEVCDQGPGIAAEHLEHLTRRFWRHTASSGSGLGLAIVQAIAQRCDCTLAFDSQADGLRVSLTVPLQR